jgi:5'-methylthioadenosine phosphorylase
VVDTVRAAVIGGSGFYEMEGLTNTEAVRIDTPSVDQLTRHGQGPQRTTRGVLLAQPRRALLPSEIPASANFWALKSLGVEMVISVSAVGSLREDIEPLHMVVPDQLIDRTRGRASSFFGEGVVAHVAFGDPFCPELRVVLAGAVRETDATLHNGGTYVVMDGPAFSTRAESNLYRTWGADIIGMTALPEAKLAREAEMCFAVLACSTDYDCWHDGHEDVTADMIVANLLHNVDVSRQAVRAVLQRLPARRDCACANALATAIVTSFDIVPPETVERLAPIVGKYVQQKVPG